MSLSDTTYFINEISLPTGDYDTIQAFADRFERDILIQLLGYDLAKLVLAYNVNTSPQRIKDIVEGKEYTEGDYTIKWNGLLNAEKVSILSYFVFCEYVKSKSVTFQNVGVIASQAEGGSNVGAAGLVGDAGYRLRELAGYCFQDPYAPSLYNFMQKHESTYPEWIFNEFKPINQFGI
jgi:hypothetical protein